MRANTSEKPIAASSSRRKILYGILIIIVLAIVGGVWYWKTHKSEIIEKKIENAIVKKSQGLYKVKYDNLKLDEVQGIVVLDNLHLDYDSSRYAVLADSSNSPSQLLKIDIPRLSLVGLKTPRALIEKEIVGRKLEIDDPVIHIRYTNKGKDAAKHIPTNEIYKQILGDLNLIQIDTIRINRAKIITSDFKTARQFIKIEQVSVALSDVRIDSAANADSARYLFAKEFNIQCSQIGWASKDGLYNFSFNNGSISSADQNLRLGSFKLTPKLGEDAFVNAIPTQDDRLDFSVNNIVIRQLNINKLLEEKLIAEEMHIGSASFKVYRDLARPRDKKSRVGLYPHQVMDEVPLLFNFRRLRVANAFIEYKEKNHISRQSGRVRFHNINGLFSNFTNDKRAIARNSLMTAEIRTSFLNKAPMYTRWDFYLNHPSGRFNVKGNTGALTAEDLNPLTEPMGPASIKKGKINGLWFDMKGSDHGMDGTVKMLYEDLKVAMLEKDKGATELDKKTLMTFLANFVIKNDNPRGNEDPRIAQVHWDRDPNRSLFNLCWKALFKGIKETVGVKK